MEPKDFDNQTIELTERLIRFIKKISKIHQETAKRSTVQKQEPSSLSTEISEHFIKTFIDWKQEFPDGFEAFRRSFQKFSDFVSIKIFNENAAFLSFLSTFVTIL